MKRDTLTRNLKEMIKRVKHTFLPVTILRVFVHGSYIRGEVLPGDLDVIIHMKVKDEFEQWHRAFSSLSECHNLIFECYEKGMSLEDAFRGPLSSEIKNRRIPMEWVATMSWSELFGWSRLCIPYMLWWDTVTRRLLTKGIKGIHIQFEMDSRAFTPISGRVYIYYEIPIFENWSYDSPQDCVLEPTKDEYEEFLKLEHKKLSTSVFDARFLKKIGEFLIKSVFQLSQAKNLEM
ncbi:MAG: hypothetical protein QXF44_03405 [Candidatus Bathyarchaeia archaeon]